MANLAFSKTIYTTALPRTHSAMTGKPLNYDEMSAIATILGDEFEVVTLTGDGIFAGFTRTEINMVCLKTNHNYGFFMSTNNSGSTYYLRVYLYLCDALGNESYKVSAVSQAQNYSNTYSVNVKTLTIQNNMKLLQFNGCYDSYVRCALFVTTAKDYNGNTKVCFCVIDSITSNGSASLYYVFDEGVSVVNPTAGSVDESYLTYIGLQKVIDSVYGIVFDDIFFTTHRADNESHFIEVEGVKFYGMKTINNSTNQYYFRDVVE